MVMRLELPSYKSGPVVGVKVVSLIHIYPTHRYRILACAVLGLGCRSQGPDLFGAKLFELLRASCAHEVVDERLPGDVIMVATAAPGGWFNLVHGSSEGDLIKILALYLDPEASLLQAPVLLKLLLESA